MSLERYFADLGSTEPTGLLAGWRWLLDEGRFDVWRVTAIGDLFLKAEDGSIWFLDVIDGRLKEFADNAGEVETKLADRHVRKNLLYSFLVRELQSLGVILEPGECYSPDVPPVLGGQSDAANLRPTDIQVHLSIMGQIHRQVRQGSRDSNTTGSGTP